MGIDRQEMYSRISERASEVDDRLEDIPNSYSLPDLEDMTIGTAKEFRLGVVFLDIAGFTEYASRNDYEDVLFMLNLFVPEAMEIGRDMDGYFEKNTGDGLMVYFGAGDSDGQVAHSVLEYLATVKTALADYINPRLEDYDVEPIRFKAGAALGTVYISRIGVHSLNRRTAVGTTANLASKLEDEANAGDYFVNHGIALAAQEADCDWAQYLNDRGQFESYTWGSDSSGWEPAHYWHFSGVWADTDTENL